jgi:putative DNA primase/helicase
MPLDEKSAFDDPVIPLSRAPARKRQSQPKPNGHAPDQTVGAVMIIDVRAGLRHEAADAGLSALRGAGIAFYQRGSSLVRVRMIEAKDANGEVTLTPGIAPVSRALLGRELGRAACWMRFSPKGERHRIDPPQAVVDQIAEMAGHWPFPTLAGAIGTPTLRPDGSLLATEGYDDATGLVLIGSPVMPPLPAAPTRNDAERSLALLDGLLDEFPFADGGKATQSVNRAVALSMIITPMARGALPPAVPMHLVNAPDSGSGKSYLADIVSFIATGHPCAVISASPKVDETEKRLIGAALSGFPIIGLDNCRDLIEGDFLCQLTERPLLQLRPLGTSEVVRVANTFTVLANGNNATIAGDMVRRTIQCALDANMENPADREFNSDPIAQIKRDRGAYIAACLTIVRAYLTAGTPGKLPRLPSYGAWSDLVRSALVWLGRPDPVATMETARNADPVRQQRGAVFAAWATELGTGGGYLTSELIARADDRDDTGALSRPMLHNSFIEVARQRGGSAIDPKRLGRWLSGATDTIANRFKLTVDRSDQTRPRWIIDRL